MQELARSDWLTLGLSVSAAAVAVLLLTGVFRYCLAWVYSKLDSLNIAHEWRVINDASDS